MTERAATSAATKPRRVRTAAAVGFLLVHAAALGVFAVGFSWKGVALCLASYTIRMFAITAGFHRYFSHRAYRLSRVPQFLLAFLGQTSAQRGVLWWAATHRHHHQFSDQPEDAHSPVQRGFFFSHIGWILSDERFHTEERRIPDLLKFPELRFLNRNEYLPTVLYAVALWLAFSWTGLFWGYFLSTVLLWHGTFSINSVMHLFGRRVFQTADDSRNSFLFALVTMGEGWHNNHHFYPGSAAQGFRWWQVDASYYLLWIGEKLGVVKGLKRAPERWRQAIGLVKAETKTRLDETIEKLSARWDELAETARAKASHAVDELEAARAAASARLAELQRDYEAARARAEAAAEERLATLRAEMEAARRQLAEALARLVEVGEEVDA